MLLFPSQLLNMSSIILFSGFVKWGNLHKKCLHLALEELKVVVPVLTGEGMASGTQMMADVALAEVVVDHRHAVGRDHALLAQQLPDLGGCTGAEELRRRVGTMILFGAGNIEKARRDHSQQHMLVVGQLVFLADVFLELLAAPFPAAGAQEVDDALAVAVLGDGSAAEAGVVGKGGPEAIVQRTAPEGGLARRE